MLGTDAYRSILIIVVKAVGRKKSPFQLLQLRLHFTTRTWIALHYFINERISLKNTKRWDEEAQVRISGPLTSPVEAATITLPDFASNAN